jgi:hypothetical protein
MDSICCNVEAWLNSLQISFQVVMTEFLCASRWCEDNGDIFQYERVPCKQDIKNVV